MPSPRRHAVIAGTGRAGTSFLVEFLAACGVPAGDIDELGWSEDARAGLERNLLESPDVYLVKDPWFSEYLHLVDPQEVAFDVLILPVRDLRAAAISRVRVEQAHLQQHGAVSSRLRLAGTVPGGVIHSLSVQDQERVLAVGQAELISWALEHSIPLVLLHFPRLVKDRDYLIDQLWPWLRQFCDRATAVDAFDRLADVSPWATSVAGDEADAPDSDLVADLRAQLEAMATALARVKTELAAALQTCEWTSAALNAAAADHAALSATTRALETELERERAELRAAHDLARGLASQLHEVQTPRESGSSTGEAGDVLRSQLAKAEERAESLSHQLDAVRQSRALRVGRLVTSPVRLARRARRA